MKKMVTWVCILTLLFLVFFYAVSSSAEKTAETAQTVQDVQTILMSARDMIGNTNNGLEILVRTGTTLILQGTVWEPLGRKKLRAAAVKASEIELLLAPFLPPHGVSTLRYMGLGHGDRVRQAVASMLYTDNFSLRIPSPISGQGEVVGGPRLYEDKTFWLIRFSQEKEGWLSEDVLIKEFPYPPDLIAAACWMQGNTVTYKMVATLRVEEEEVIVGERNAAIKDHIAAIIAAYECALGMYSLPESIGVVGVEEAARAREIIKKNFPIIQEQQKESQKKTAEARVDSKAEDNMMRAILGDEAKRKRGTQTVMIPIPQREGDPDRHYSPGTPVGVH